MSPNVIDITENLILVDEIPYKIQPFLYFLMRILRLIICCLMRYEALIHYLSTSLRMSLVWWISLIHSPLYTNSKDEFMLGLTGNGLFSTSSCYHLIQSQDIISQGSNDFSINTWIWKIKVPNKIKIFMRLLYHCRLPTCHYLNRIG